jgi:4-oxalmesaconate hydratase
VEELERCVTEQGFVGCNVNPDIAGGREPFTPSLGDEWWYPLWAKLVELDIPATMHASASLNPAMHVTSSYYIAQHHSGAVELLSSRVFQDFPTLKIVIPHGGGAIPYQWNRHRSMHVRGGLEPFEEAVRRVYWDMAIYDKESMELLIKRVGVDNVFFATEMFGATNAIDPQTGRNFEETVPLLQSIEWLTDEDRYKITEGNVRKVYNRMTA